MRARLQDGRVILTPDDESEGEILAAWLATARDHVFHLAQGSAKGAALFDMGARAEACREPINILFDQGDERWRPISNLAETPFMLDGRFYASIEGFWQGLRFADDKNRLRVAKLSGKAAKTASAAEPRQEHFEYQGRQIATGGHAHHALMAQACRAKFTQHAIARETLLATGTRPLTHVVRRDSKTIPGVLMAAIWMRLRAELCNAPGS